nr:GIY-YIG nuclease family protein [Chryseobacterium cheonjiense]
MNEGIYKFYVYILTNKSRTVLYTGVTGNLHQRLFSMYIKLIRIVLLQGIMLVS